MNAAMTGHAAGRGRTRRTNLNAKPWRRPTEDERQGRRLSEDWWPGEWLEPVHPDIARPFIERYLTAMGSTKTEWLRAQTEDMAVAEAPDGVRSVGDAVDDADSGDGMAPDDVNARRSISFLNLCLIVDQDSTFPVGTRNLRTIDYRPSGDSVDMALTVVREEFDRFVDFLTGLGPVPGRDEVTAAIAREYQYEGDIEAWGFLDVLARRAARRLAVDELERWAARRPADLVIPAGDGSGDAGAGECPEPTAQVARILSRWGLPLRVDDGPDSRMDAVTGNLAAYRADPRRAWERAAEHWVKCIERSVRNTPRNRNDVLRWCVWDATLGEVWDADRATWRARRDWRPRQRLLTRGHAGAAASKASAEIPSDDNAIAGTVPMPAITTGPLDGGAWERLMGRMLASHRKVSQSYAKWSPSMPSEKDKPALSLACEEIAAAPEFRARVLFGACNALNRGTVDTPTDAASAMDMLLAYACTRLTVPGAPKDGLDGDAERYAYVGLLRAIRSYPPYQGQCRTLGPDAYRQYLKMIGKKPKDGDLDDGKRHTVWVFPNMDREPGGKTDESGRESWQVQADTVSASQGTDGVADAAIGIASGMGTADDAGQAESWSRFHAVADTAVNAWLGSETVHASGLDGHGHALSYRAKDPVVAYQDMNAWRLGEALERYEGAAAWGSGGRLADLYRMRGHLDKGGKPAADRSVRDYAASARGAADAIQYLAAITGLGGMGMLSGAEQVERFIRIIDRCGQGTNGTAADRLGKAQWTLTSMAKDKRHRLTIPDATGRRASAAALLAAMGVTLRREDLRAEGDPTHAMGDPSAITRMAKALKIDRLLRAWGVADAGDASGDGYGARDWRAVANAIDLAEHYMRFAIHGLLRKELSGPHRTADGRPLDAAGAAAQALGRSRWLARLEATPMPCLGRGMNALIGGDTCLFHRDAAGRTGANANGRRA